MGLWCRLQEMGPEDELVATWAVSGPGHPHLSVVEGLAGLRLAALRRGNRVVLAEPCPELLELLDLVGLLRQVGWQPEEGEEPLGVEKGMEPGDLPA
jgi:hypothetical protein